MLFYAFSTLVSMVNCVLFIIIPPLLWFHTKEVLIYQYYFNALRNYKHVLLMNAIFALASFYFVISSCFNSTIFCLMSSVQIILGIFGKKLSYFVISRVRCDIIFYLCTFNQSERTILFIAVSTDENIFCYKMIKIQKSLFLMKYKYHSISIAYSSGKL